jgi:hypothetical protein
MSKWVMVKKVTLGILLLSLVLSAYHFVSRQVFLKAAKAAFPKLPIDSSCNYLPWPVGPLMYGQLNPDDSVYLTRDSVERYSQGLHLIIHDSDGSFIVEPD